jgi:hypothetical protein
MNQKKFRLSGKRNLVGPAREGGHRTSYSQSPDFTFWIGLCPNSATPAPPREIASVSALDRSAVVKS